MKHVELDFLIREPEDVYHSKAKDHLSSTQLKTFRRCPKEYYEQKLGLMGGPKSRDLDVGSGIHTLVLEGREAFDREFQFGGEPVNPKTNKPYVHTSDKYKAWRAAQTRCVLTETEGAVIERMAMAIKAHPLAMSLLSIGQAEGVIRTKMHGHDCQVRIDWLNPEVETIVDLKSTIKFSSFEWELRRRNYIHQMAFYLAAVRMATGSWIEAHIIALEKEPPFRVGVWRINAEALLNAHIENVLAMEEISLCEAHGQWPTRYEDVRVIESLNYEREDS